jgi:hypothetical protein
MAGWVYAPAFFVLKPPVALKTRALGKITLGSGGWLKNCYDGKAGISLLEESRTKDNEAGNAEGRFCPRALSGFKENC